MILKTIPLATYQAPHPRNPFIKERSDMACGSNFFMHLAARELMLETQDRHKSDAERYAEQWKVAA
jgi:hypothetical protein